MIAPLLDTVEFASFNYNNDRNRLFEYRLEGFDKAWTQTTGTTSICPRMSVNGVRNS